MAAQNTRRVDPIAELSERICGGGKYAHWNSISSHEAWEGFRLPSKVLYEFVQKCPAKFADNDRNVRGDMLIAYRDHVLNGLTVENLPERERRFMTYVQAASFAGFDEYLKAKTLVLIAYLRTVKHPIPLSLKERMTTCERWHRARGAFTEANFIAAGYEGRGNGRMVVLVHPQSRDSVTLIDTAEVISVADKAQMRAHTEAAKQARRDARPGPERGTGAKSAEGGGTSKKSLAKDKKRGKK